MEGGADCADSERCNAVIASGGGTNIGLPTTLAEYFKGDYTGSAIIDPNAKNNPGLYDSNVVYVPYCTADFHAGQQTGPIRLPNNNHNSSEFWFNGHHVISAAIDFIIAKHAGARCGYM